MSSLPVRAQVERISPLTDSILEVILTPERYIDYRPGQYLEIISAGEALSYSIANAPLGAHKYELHIRHSQDNSSNQKLLAEIRKTGAVTLRLPFGDCHLDNLQAGRPVLFIAKGTGFAPVKAMIEQLLAGADKRDFELFWGGRSQSDLYMNEKVVEWQAHVAHFRYFASVSTSSRETLANKVLDHHQHDLKNWQFVIAGPFDMVYAIRDSLLAGGASPAQLFSDAFSFEEKESK